MAFVIFSMQRLRVIKRSNGQLAMGIGKLGKLSGTNIERTMVPTDTAGLTDGPNFGNQFHLTEGLQLSAMRKQPAQWHSEKAGQCNLPQAKTACPPARLAAPSSSFRRIGFSLGDNVMSDPHTSAFQKFQSIATTMVISKHVPEGGRMEQKKFEEQPIRLF